MDIKFVVQNLAEYIKQNENERAKSARILKKVPYDKNCNM